MFQRGYDHLKRQELKEERLLLLEAWRAVEREKGDAQGTYVGGLDCVFQEHTHHFYGRPAYPTTMKNAITPALQGWRRWRRRCRSG